VFARGVDMEPSGRREFSNRQGSLTPQGIEKIDAAD
jgi:hypothetical protein